MCGRRFKLSIYLPLTLVYKITQHSPMQCSLQSSGNQFLKNARVEAFCCYHWMAWYLITWTVVCWFSVIHFIMSITILPFWWFKHIFRLTWLRCFAKEGLANTCAMNSNYITDVKLYDGFRTVCSASFTKVSIMTDILLMGNKLYNIQ